MNYPDQNPNPNYSSYFADLYHNINMDHHHQSSELELSDYLIFDDYDGFNEDSYSSQSMASSDKIIMNGSSSSGATSENSNIKCRNAMTRTKVEVGQRIAFRTKSELEVMDDGFKWRKYGKKSVKNSPNPRNYYKCSTGGCHVKKRVERDREDSSYVITTYEGIHNHESPCLAYDYYNPHPHHHHHHHDQMAQNAWSFQPSSTSPPSSFSS